MAEAVPAAAAAVPADSPPSVLTALHGQPSALAPLEELLSVELNFSNLGGILQTLLKTAHAQQVQAQAAVGREQEMQDRIDALEARLAVVESDAESDGDGRPRSRSSSPSYKAAMAKAAALKQEAEQAAALAREQEAALAKAREESALMRERMEGQVAAPAPQPSPPPAFPHRRRVLGERARGGGASWRVVDAGRERTGLQGCPPPPSERPSRLSVCRRSTTRGWRQPSRRWLSRRRRRRSPRRWSPRLITLRTPAPEPWRGLRTATQA
jgi:hypothetical protein